MNDFFTENRQKARRKRKKPVCNSHTQTNGYIGLNIDRFNTAMGTAFETSTDNNVGGAGLTEAKRYVRRYYIRPQNIFCSNKAEILKALIELDDANCSVYTLNNLGDEKDVSKLMNSDIIYYYDNGILYDKNKVKVMDYDLSIKKEENRKHFANVKKASDREFKTAYEDRMTDVTELEETLMEEAFNLSFDDIDVFGNSLNEDKFQYCCRCGEPLNGYGHNPEPVVSADEGRFCDACNLKWVIPARLNTFNALAEED